MQVCPSVLASALGAEAAFYSAPRWSNASFDLTATYILLRSEHTQSRMVPMLVCSWVEAPRAARLLRTKISRNAGPMVRHVVGLAHDGAVVAHISARACQGKDASILCQAVLHCGPEPGVHNRILCQAVLHHDQQHATRRNTGKVHRPLQDQRICTTCRLTLRLRGQEGRMSLTRRVFPRSVVPKAVCGGGKARLARWERYWLRS